MSPALIIRNHKIWIERLTLLLVSILVFFVLGEIIIRLLVPIEPPSPAMFQRLPSSPRLIGPIPNFESKDKLVKINSKGFRDHEYHEEKRENTLRIIVLGDSFTFGVGVTLENAYPKQLEKMLNKKSSSRPVEILNMGVPGYNTYQELILLKEVGLNYKPDLVIVGFVLNDVDLLDPDLLSSEGIERQRLLADKVVGDSKPKIFKLYRFIKSKSQFLYFILFRLSALVKQLDLPVTTEATYYRDAYHEYNRGWQIAKRSLKEIVDLGRIKNFQVLVVIFPFLANLDDSYLWSDAHHQIESFCKSQDIQVVDLFPYFKGYRPGTLWISLIDSHPNAKGQQIAAKAVYEEILRNNLFNKM